MKHSIETPQEGLMQQKKQRRPLRSFYALLQDSIQFLAWLIALVAAIVGILTYFNIGPNIPVLTQFFQNIFQHLGH